MARLLAVSLLGLALSACGGQQQVQEPPAELEAVSEEAETETQPSGLEDDLDARITTAEAAGFANPGEQVYAERCGTCHDNAEALRAPSLANLKAMSPAQLEFSLTDGKMKLQAEGMSRLDIALVVDYLAPGPEGGYAVPEDAYCGSADISFAKSYVSNWGVGGDNSRYYDAERSTITRANAGDLEVAWVFGMPGTSEMRSQPVITDDTLFAASTSGRIFALDRETGCVKWLAHVQKPIRTPLTLGDIDDEPVLFFADATTTVYALRASNGEVLWSKRAGVFTESVSTGGVVQHSDTIYVPLSSYDVAAAMNPEHECCKSHGAVAAHDARSGERIWLARMTKDAEPTTLSSVGTQLWGPSGAPVWTTPAIDAANGRLYIGTGENTSAPATDTSDAIIALDMESGDRLWVYQATAKDTYNMDCSPFRGSGPNCPSPPGPDFDFGGAVTRATFSDGREVVVGGQKSGTVHVVDAGTGEMIWKTKIASGSALGGTHWGVSVANNRVFAPSNDPPFPIPFYQAKPGLYALDLETGEELWSVEAERGCSADFESMRDNPEPWPECSFFYAFSAAPAANDELVFAGALDGVIRAFDVETGDVLWRYDTKREFESVSGVAAHGGAIDNAGPQLAGDMLFVQSGYAMFGQMPGNALIAFRVKNGE